jgi:hypothetical protein
MRRAESARRAQPGAPVRARFEVGPARAVELPRSTTCLRS